MNLFVVDGTDDDNGFLKAHRTTGPEHLVVSSLDDMVARILARLGPTGTIDRLVIVGHAFGGEISTGGGEGNRIIPRLAGHLRPGETIGEADRSQEAISVLQGHLRGRAHLARLCGRFAPDAVVELQGCHAALGHHGRELLRQLVELWHVRVRGSVENQHWDPVLVGHARPGFRFEGQVIEAAEVPGHHARVRAVRR